MLQQIFETISLEAAELLWLDLICFAGESIGRDVIGSSSSVICVDLNNVDYFLLRTSDSTVSVGLDTEVSFSRELWP